MLRARCSGTKLSSNPPRQPLKAPDSEPRGRARPRRAPRRLTWWQPGRRRFTPAATRHVSAEMSQPPGAVAAMGRLASIPWLLYAGAWRSPAEARPHRLSRGREPSLTLQFELTAARCWIPMQFAVPSLWPAAMLDLCLLISPHPRISPFVPGRCSHFSFTCQRRYSHL